MQAYSVMMQIGVFVSIIGISGCGGESNYPAPMIELYSNCGEGNSGVEHVRDDGTNNT